MSYGDISPSANTVGKFGFRHNQQSWVIFGEVLFKNINIAFRVLLSPRCGSSRGGGEMSSGVLGAASPPVLGAAVRFLSPGVETFPGDGEVMSLLGSSGWKTGHRGPMGLGALITLSC